ncbi:MAG: DUF370 domain-containing protein [Candidatus Adiutrix sp.]|jgi:regulator of extracellular matrix RemA (YlzA/DUF370 family)|nr:DUF370 domain-containing protein [Candidatus Adiutrix sp.]
MQFKLVNAGHNNMVAMDKVVAIVSPNSAPAKRLKDEAKAAGRLVDMTQGKPTRSLIITSAHHLILSDVKVETLAARFNAAAVRPLEDGDIITIMDES